MNRIGRVGALLGVVPLLALSLGAGCVTVKGGKEGQRDRKAAASLQDLARAVETLDPDKVAAFYTADALSAVLDRSPRHTTGVKGLREEIARTLSKVAAIHVEPRGEERTWKDGPRAWTIQDFNVTGTLKDGQSFTLEVHYSAVWRRVSGRWLIEYEHLMGPPPAARTSPAKPS